jgi:hypothetical protein
VHLSFESDLLSFLFIAFYLIIVNLMMPWRLGTIVASTTLAINLVVLFLVIAKDNEETDVQTDWRNVGAVYVSAIGFFVYLSWQSYNREFFIRRNFLRQRQMELGEKASHDILTRMLPVAVVEKMRAGVGCIVDDVKACSVLFRYVFFLFKVGLCNVNTRL